jgi:hypothetical protein
MDVGYDIFGIWHEERVVRDDMVGRLAIKLGRLLERDGNISINSSFLEMDLPMM